MQHEQICPICLAWMLDDQPGWLKCLGCCNQIKRKNSMISMKELLNDIKFEELTPELQTNANDLLVKINQFRSIYGIPMYVNSGYRTPEHNVEIGGAKNSAHCTCQAMDFRDEDNAIKEWILKDPSVLEKCELYMENPDKTKTWVHLQSRIIKSGNRIFNP